jgi:hypothetical protein
MAVSRLSQHSIQNAFPKGNTVWDGTTATSAFDSLGAFTLSSAASSVVFSNIPQTYSHLQVRGISRNSANVSGDFTQFRLNGDSGSNYYVHWLVGAGFSGNVPTSGSNGALTAYGAVAYNTADGSYSSDVFGGVIFDILDYTNSNKNKTVRSIFGGNTNLAATGANQHVGLVSTLWLSTAAITSLTIYPFNVGSNNFVANTSFALYGIK